MKPIHYLLIIVVVLVGIFGLYLYNHFQPDKIPAFKVEQKDSVLSVTVTGEVRADETINISSPVNALIKEIFVDDGDMFSPGQTLVALDHTEASGRIHQARGELKRAEAALKYQIQGTRAEDIEKLKAEYETYRKNILKQQALLISYKAELEKALSNKQRFDTLYQKGVIAKHEHEDVLAKFKTAQEAVSAQQAETAIAQSQLKQSEEQLKKARYGPTKAEIDQAGGDVYAATGALQSAESKIKELVLKGEFNGTVIKRLMEPGETVTSGKPILRVVNPETYEVVAFVEESDLARVEKGDKAYVVLDAWPDEALEGRVREVGNEVNATNGTVEARITLSQDALKKLGKLTLRQGMTADINILTAKLKQAMLIPATAVTQNGRKLVVYQIKDTALKEQPVIARRMSTEYYQVLEGLQPGDWISEMANPILLNKQRVAPKIRQRKP